jgi:hypothetical protein
MDRWERRYWFSQAGQASAPDNSTIDFDFRQAGFEEFRAGRNIHSAPHLGVFDVDDREYNLAVGTYDVKADRLSIEACGPNMG